jgi:hypothetical protein
MTLSKCLVCSVLLAVSSAASADIVVTDQFTTGDNLAVQDTVSGFRWMRLTSTTGLSVAQMQARMAAGGDLQGFAYASTEQINNLFISAGAAYTYGYFFDTPENRTACAKLLNVMGTTYTINGGVPNPDARSAATGYTAAEGYYGRALGGYLIDTFGGGFMSISANDGSGNGGADSGIGHFVVMVPAPGAVALFGAVGLVGSRRRRA